VRRDDNKREEDDEQKPRQEQPTSSKTGPNKPVKKQPKKTSLIHSIEVASKICLLADSPKGIDLDKMFRRICEAADIDGLYLWGFFGDGSKDIHANLLGNWARSQPVDGNNTATITNLLKPTTRYGLLRSLRRGEIVKLSRLHNDNQKVKNPSFAEMLFVPIQSGDDLRGLIGIQGVEEIDQSSAEITAWAYSLGNLLGTVLNANYTRQALEESQDLLHSVFDSMSSGVLVTDKEGLVLLVNPAAADCLALSPQELLGKKLKVVLPAAETLTEVTAPGEQRSVQVKVADGREIIIGFTSTLLSYRGHRVSVFRDTTPIIENQQRRRRAEQLANVGEMAARLAHEIKNPLASVLAGLELLESKAVLSYSQNSILQSVIEEARSVSHIIGGLLSSSRPSSLNPELVRMGRALYDIMVPLLELASRHSVNIDVLPPAKDAYVVIDIAAFGRVMRNLIVNAVEACAPSGQVDVSWRLLDEPEKSALFSGFIGDILVVKIADNGEGIPKNKLREVFQPFATSKEKGTGLGLAVATDIVNSHGGIISADSIEGKGAVFSIYLAAGKRQPCWEDQTICSAHCNTCEVHKKNSGYLCWSIIGDLSHAETQHWPDMCRRCTYFNLYNIQNTFSS